MQTLQATINESGVVTLLEPVHLASKHAAIVTILDDSDAAAELPKTEAERLAAIDAAMGAMAHVPFSSDDLMREKQFDKIREDRHWKGR
jgi:hypothetical protein